MALKDLPHRVYLRQALRVVALCFAQLQGLGCLQEPATWAQQRLQKGKASVKLRLPKITKHVMMLLMTPLEWNLHVWGMSSVSFNEIKSLHCKHTFLPVNKSQNVLILTVWDRCLLLWVTSWSTYYVLFEQSLLHKVSQVNNNINSFINCVNTIIIIILLYTSLCPVYLWKKKAWLPSCK